MLIQTVQLLSCGRSQAGLLPSRIVREATRLRNTLCQFDRRQIVHIQRERIMRHVAGIPDSSWVTRLVGFVGFETVSADLLELGEFKSRGGGIHGAEQPGFEIRSECGLAIRDVCRCSCGVLVAEDDLAVGAVGPDLTARQVPALPPLLVVG